jgi:hypothetical protein
MPRRFLTILDHAADIIGFVSLKRGRKVSDAGRGLASCLAFLFAHFFGRNSFDRFLLLAGKPIGHTHNDAEKA